MNENSTKQPENKLFSLIKREFLLAIGLEIFISLVIHFFSLFEEIAWILPSSLTAILVAAICCLLLTVISIDKGKAISSIIGYILIAIVFCACCFIFLNLIALVPIEKSKAYEQLQYIVTAFNILIGTLIPLAYWKSKNQPRFCPIPGDNALCPIHDQIHSFRNQEYAVTGTCIPFKLIDENKIATYLIYNSAWKESKWMFPGGHAFLDSDASPETIAIGKTKDEAGITVSIIDMYGSYDIKDETDMGQSGKSFSVLRAPHFTYLFELADTVKCYTRGHRYHYDLVYVGEITEIGSEQHAKFKRLEIILPKKLITRKQIENVIVEALTAYIRKEKLDNRHYEYGQYVTKMLYEAHKDYIALLESCSKENAAHG